jgi:hypothetical protein
MRNIPARSNPLSDRQYAIDLAADSIGHFAAESARDDSAGPESTDPAGNYDAAGNPDSTAGQNRHFDTERDRNEFDSQRHDIRWFNQWQQVRRFDSRPLT